MKKVLLFSRCQLVHLYGTISKNLESNVEVIHLAYSITEEDILKKNYNIKKIINFNTEVEIISKVEKLDLKKCEEIDNEIIKYSNNRFCLNSALQSDRTFQFISYEESLLLAQVYYKFWDEMLKNKDIDFIIHEPNSLYFNQIASILAKKYKAFYLSQIQVIGQNKYNWIFVEADSGFSLELTNRLENNKVRDIDYRRAKSFLEDFRKKNGVLLSEISKHRKQKKRLLIFFWQIVLLFIRHAKRKIDSMKSPTYSFYSHMDLYKFKSVNSFLEDFSKKLNYYFHINYDEFDVKKEYYFYPLHLEPEAVVLYWGDGFYKNQVKLIENIAAQLPPNTYLYVKDHPHAREYRDFADYKKIQAIPNVKLLDPNISSRPIILKSKGVFTINGTAGFEALLMNKQVYVFGNSFYNISKRVIKVKNIRDLRKLLYHDNKEKYKDDDDLYRFVYSYLESTYSGFVAYFSDYVKRVNIDVESNSLIVTKGIIQGLSNISSNGNVPNAIKYKLQ